MDLRPIFLVIQFYKRVKKKKTRFTKILFLCSMQARNVVVFNFEAFKENTCHWSRATNCTIPIETSYDVDPL